MKFFIEPSTKFVYAPRSFEENIIKKNSVEYEFRSKKTLAYKVRKSGGWFDFNETILDELTFEEAAAICDELNEKYKAGLIK